MLILLGKEKQMILQSLVQPMSYSAGDKYTLEVTPVRPQQYGCLNKAKIRTPPTGMLMREREVAQGN